jgi:catechol 2,3-dioxygenase-like lactoylglutathione lyase family enzyme
MSRLQLALNVDDIDEAVAFYSTLFGTGPAKRRPGYANFAIDDPALKLVLIENRGQGGSLNHLGVEVGSTHTVAAETRRLSAAGLPTAVQDGTTCCYALQDKVWVDGPQGHRWEIYTVLADAGVELEGHADGDRTYLHDSQETGADGRPDASAACC